MKDRRQYVPVDNISLKTLDIKSGVPQRTLLGPFLFCIFTNDFSDVLMSSEPFIITDDLKFLAVQRKYWEFQDDLHWIENCVI